MIPKSVFTLQRIVRKIKPTLHISHIARVHTSTRNSQFLVPNLSTRSPIAKRARLDAPKMASTSSVSATSAFEPSDFGDYKLLSSFDIKYAPIKVGKWRSEKTGLSVVVGSYEGRYFVVEREGHS